MANPSEKTTGASTEESVVRELGDAELEAATGGFSLSGAWDDVKDGASDVVHELEEPPKADLYIAAGLMGGVGESQSVNPR